MSNFPIPSLLCKVQVSNIDRLALTPKLNRYYSGWLLIKKEVVYLNLSFMATTADKAKSSGDILRCALSRTP